MKQEFSSQLHHLQSSTHMYQSISTPSSICKSAKNCFVLGDFLLCPPTAASDRILDHFRQVVWWALVPATREQSEGMRQWQHEMHVN